jgi:hypothetical protein
MAQVTHYNFGWLGYNFYPGAEHHWVWEGLPYPAVWQIVATPVKGAPWPYELMVKDMRINSAPGRSGWTLLFTVLNMGAGSSEVPAYGLHISSVEP